MLNNLNLGSYREVSIVQMARFKKSILDYINQRRNESMREWINRIEATKALMRGCPNYESILNSNLPSIQLKKYVRDLYCDGYNYATLPSLAKLAVDKGMHYNQFKQYDYDDELLMEIINAYEYNINLADYIEKYNLMDKKALQAIVTFKIYGVNLEPYINKVDLSKLKYIGKILKYRPHLADNLNNDFNIDQLKFLCSIIDKKDFRDDLINPQYTKDEMEIYYICIEENISIKDYMGKGYTKECLNTIHGILSVGEEIPPHINSTYTPSEILAETLAKKNEIFIGDLIGKSFNIKQLEVLIFMRKQHYNTQLFEDSSIDYLTMELCLILIQQGYNLADLIKGSPEDLMDSLVDFKYPNLNPRFHKSDYTEPQLIEVLSIIKNNRDIKFLSPNIPHELIKRFSDMASGGYNVSFIKKHQSSKSNIIKILDFMEEGVDITPYIENYANMENIDLIYNTLKQGIAI